MYTYLFDVALDRMRIAVACRVVDGTQHAQAPLLCESNPDTVNPKSGVDSGYTPRYGHRHSLIFFNAFH